MPAAAAPIRPAGRVLSDAPDAPLRIVLSNASSGWGGLHTVTEALARGLLARGHEVALLCRPRSVLEARMRGIVPLLPLLGAVDGNPLVIARAAAALRVRRADVLLALSDKDVRLAVPAAWLARVPSVVRRPNDRPLKPRAYVRLLYGALPARHVANSEATRRTILASAPWIDAARVAVVHNGMAPPPRRRHPRTGPPVFGFLGRFEEEKGVLELAEAWPRVAAALPGARLLLAGKGRMERRMRALLADTPGVEWLGYRDDVPALLRSIDVVAVPSHSEGFGMTALEAMAAGAVVVASTAGALPELVRDGVEGLLVPAGDPAALSAALVRAGGDRHLAATLGRAGMRRARAFSLDAMVEGIEAVLRAAARAR